ncbi:MAG: ABC transporter permease, partial [Planctomycetaceae bacterium]|nr:ABC transporter permease [Planctomycetaceae bacterium]
MYRLILNSILHYRRTHLAVMAAVAVSTAVIAGALIVGDSMRSSLRDMSLKRLGRITHVLTSPRFIRQQLAADIAGNLAASERIVAPAMLMTGSVERIDQDNGRHRAGSVVLLGTDENGWSLLETGHIATPSADGVVLGYRTAQELNAETGQQVSLWVELPSSIPRDSLLGERDETVQEIVLTVEAILPEEAGASRFSLNPAQQLPNNAFLSLQTLQERLNLHEVVPSKRNPIARSARINTILVGDRQTEEKPHTHVPDPQANSSSLTSTLAESLKAELQLEDPGVHLRIIADRGYVSAESDSMILEPPLVEAIIAGATGIGMETAPTQVYLANEIRAAGSTDDEQRFSMYSIVAAVDPESAPPLGPFLLNDGTPMPALKDDEIVLSAWLAKDLQLQAGGVVEARWHDVGSHGDLPEIHHKFQVVGVLSETDTASIDRDLTPFVDGVTNVDSFSDWDQPFEMEMGRLTDRDDEYWPIHGPTPKAFVSPATAGRLWSSRFGRYTSVRIAPRGQKLPPERIEQVTDRMAFEIRQRLDPATLGLRFRPVREEGLKAAVGANNFSQLFLGFSFFLIVSAVLLAGLMFQLGIQRRIPQIGLLQALGFTTSQARRILLMEGVTVAIAGAVAGAAAGVAAAHGMIYGLTTWWVGAVGTTRLTLDIQPLRLLIAAAISVVLSALVIWNAVRVLGALSTRELLSGGPDESHNRPPTAAASMWRLLRRVSLTGGAIVSIILPLATVSGKVPNQEAFEGITWPIVCFFVAGFALLTTGLTFLSSRLRRRDAESISGQRFSSLFGLAMANAARNSNRTVLTTALIAFATFVIVTVAACRRNPVGEAPDRSSGNGGFRLVAESSQPILFDLNTKEGRSKLQLDLNEDTTLPEGTLIHAFSMKPGQDASCLNLFQTQIPTLLGAESAFIERGGFRFANTPGDQPWNNLLATPEPVNGLPTIPVIG